MTHVLGSTCPRLSKTFVQTSRPLCMHQLQSHLKVAACRGCILQVLLVYYFMLLRQWCM